MEPPPWRLVVVLAADIDADPPDDPLVSDDDDPPDDPPNVKRPTWKKIRVDHREGREGRRQKRPNKDRTVEWKRKKNAKKAVQRKIKRANAQKKNPIDASALLARRQAQMRANRRVGVKGRRQLSMVERVRIDELRNLGGSGPAVAAAEPPSQSWPRVQDKLHAYAVEDAKRAGRPPPERKRSLVTLMRYGKRQTHSGPRRKGAPPIPLPNKKCLVSMSKKIRKKRKDKGITPLHLAMAAASWPGSLSAAYNAMKDAKMAARRCRIKPKLFPAQRKARYQRAKEILKKIDDGELDKNFFTEELIYSDCKTFTVQTTQRKKMIYRQGQMRWVWRTRSEGLLDECTRASAFQSKGGGRGYKVFAAVGDGKLLMFQEYRKWSGAKAAELTGMLRAACEKAWPEKKATVLHLCHDNDKCFTSGKNKDAEADAMFSHFQIPVRSPELMPLDYSHWRWILDDMQRQEDEMPWSEKPETRQEYIDRLTATAFRMPEEVIRKAHRCMVDHLEQMKHHRGGHWEDGSKAIRRWRSTRMTEEKRARELEAFKRNGDFPKWLKDSYEEFFPGGMGGAPLPNPQKDGGGEGAGAGAGVAAGVLAAALLGQSGLMGEKEKGKKRKHWTQTFKERGFSPNMVRLPNKLQKDPERPEVPESPKPKAKPKPKPKPKPKLMPKRQGKKPDAPPDSSQPPKKPRQDPPLPPENAPEPEEVQVGQVRADRGGGRIEVTHTEPAQPVWNKKTKEWEYRGVTFEGPGGVRYRRRTEFRREGVVVCPAPADGSCLFYCFSPFTGLTAEELRRAVADAIRNLPPETPCLEGLRFQQQSGRMPRALSLAVADLGGWADADFDLLRAAYADELVRPRSNGTFGFWGGEFEMGILAHLFPVRIRVHERARDGRVVFFLEKTTVVSAVHGADVELLDVLVLHQDGVHYDMLLPEA